MLLFFKFNLLFLTILLSDGIGLAKADCPDEFDKCLVTYLPDYKTADIKTSKDLIYFLDLPPATWNRICTNAFWIAQCMDDTSCFTSDSQYLYLTGIKDFIIVICESYERTNLKEIYECAGKKPFMKEIGDCFPSVTPTCVTKEKEYTCVKRIDNTPEYCIENNKMSIIYFSLFNPWAHFIVPECVISNKSGVWKNCNEVTYSKCTDSINKFHENFLNQIDGESSQQRIDRAQKLCTAIQLEEKCLKELNCLKGGRKPYLTAKVLRLLKSATALCEQDLTQLSKCSPDLGKELNKCYIKSHMEITECEYFNSIKVCYYQTTKKETCFELEVFAKFTSELINPLIYAFNGGIPYCPTSDVIPSECMNKFTSCLNDLKGGSNELFLDFSNSNLFHKQLSAIFKIDPVSWDKYCIPTLYNRHLDCFAEANCYEKNAHLYGVRDLVIYACHSNKRAFQRISKCLKKEEFLSSLNKCLTGLNNCGVGQTELKCVTDLCENQEYCCSKQDLEDIFVTFFQPKYSSELLDEKCQLSPNTALVPNPCNEIVRKRCSPALDEFHKELLIERKRLNDIKLFEMPKRDFVKICLEIENSKQCLMDAKCFEDNINNNMYFKGLWDSAEYLCKERLEDLKNIINCYDLKAMKSIDEENDECQAKILKTKTSKCLYYQDINACIRDALTARDNCFNVEVYSYYFSQLWLPHVKQEDPDCNLYAKKI